MEVNNSFFTAAAAASISASASASAFSSLIPSVHGFHLSTSASINTSGVSPLSRLSLRTSVGASAPASVPAAFNSLSSSSISIPIPNFRSRTTRIITCSSFSSKSSSNFKVCCPSSATVLLSKSTETEPQPQFISLKAFAPATIANLGPGFDFLGCALDGIGDCVDIQIDPDVTPGEVSISHISDAGFKISKNPHFDCAGITGMAVMKMLGVKSVGVSITVEKGLSLGSDLSSSAARVAATAVAINAMFGAPLSQSELVLAVLESELKALGYLAAPAILGDFVLIRSYDPLEIMQLKLPDESNLYFVLVKPELQAPPGKKIRSALQQITISRRVWNCSSQAGALPAYILQGDINGLGKAIVEPRSAPWIPGMSALKNAAIEAGAIGCTISGAGPTMVAVTDNKERAWKIAARMVDAFMKEENLKATAMVKRVDKVGARVISTVPTSK